MSKSNSQVREQIRSQIARKYNDEINELKSQLNSKEAENKALQSELEKYKALDLQLAKMKLLLNMDEKRLKELLYNIELVVKYGGIIEQPISLLLDEKGVSMNKTAYSMLSDYISGIFNYMR